VTAATVRTLLLALLVGLAVSGAEATDLLLVNGHVWTGDSELPWADSVAIEDGSIVAVGSYSQVRRYRDDANEVIDLEGRFVAPGFIDNHTHFNRAGALILGVNLLDVSDGAGLVRRVTEARDRLPAGAWIVGGDWGAYEAWEQGSSGARASDGATLFEPDRSLIDDITPENPVLLSRWDRSSYLANGIALERSGVACTEDGVDCDQTGRPTGRLSPEAAERVRETIPPKSMEQRLAEAEVALERLRGFGVTTFHDITPPEQMAVFQELERRGLLTSRVYARPTLDRWQHLAALGIEHGYGNEWLKIGGLKGFVDGIMGNSSARFYEPYLTSGERGSWRAMMEPPGNMQKLLVGADAAGHWPQVHAIGDEAIDHLLDLFQEVEKRNGERERRLRIIHTQVIRGPEVAERMAKMGVIAEVQPYHCIDDMRWMEQRIGERSRWAYAFKTLEDAGVTLSFGSDWPGTNASWYPANPLLGIYAAVTRQTLGGEPAEGWFPEERVSLETALRAYTVNNAWAAGEEAIKGSVSPGKLADLVVLDRDPFEVEPHELKDLRVVMTLVGGDVVYERSE
jgi:predicted amidohydrolase YtcJ